jgi:hypothetical protein
MPVGRRSIRKHKPFTPTKGREKIGALKMNIHTTPDRIDYQLTRAFVAIELQSQDRIDQAIDRLAIRLLVQA